MLGDFFNHGVQEGAKCAVHLAVFIPAALCAGYNLIAYVRRGDFHLAVNSVIYTALLVWEAHHIRGHWS